MTNNELNKYTTVLETMQTELVQVLRNRERIVIEKSPDAFDEIQHATERELAIRNLARESGLLRNVGEALRRIDDGTFGMCLRCQGDISPKRLPGITVDPFCMGVPAIAGSRPVGDAGDPAEWLVSAV